MEKIELTYEKLCEILSESHNEEVMENYYELALQDGFVARTHGQLVVLLLLLVRHKFEKLFVKNIITPEYFLGLSTFNEDDEYWKFGELLERTNFEMGFWIITEEPADEKPFVEFSEIYAYYLFCIGDYFMSLKKCGDVLFRDPNSTICNFIKASLIDLCYINNIDIPYKIALVNYQKKLIDKCDHKKFPIDKSVFDTVCDEINKLYKEIPEEAKELEFTKIKDDYEETKKQIPGWTKEHDFCLQKRLLLNPLTNFGKFVEASAEEFDALPISQEYAEYFKEIIDDYKLCRSIAFSYYNGINNVGKREMSMVYSYAYSIFDKAAFLIKKVFDIDIEDNRVCFTKKGLFNKQIKGSGIKFEDMKNSNVVPLYRIMQKVRLKNDQSDALQIGTFEHFELRNTIEHKSIKLVDDGRLKRNTDFLLGTTRDLILYTFLLLHGYNSDIDWDNPSFTGTTYFRALETLNEKVLEQTESEITKPQA